MLHAPQKTGAGFRIRRKNSLFAAAIAFCLAILAFSSFYRHPPLPQATSSRIGQDPVSGLYFWSAGEQPFYLRGVVYHAGDKPRAKGLQKDFSLIRDMGANAIICQGEITASVWRAAAANELKVIARLPLDSSAVAALQQIQLNALLALSLFATDIPPEKAQAVLAEIRQTAPDIPIILEWPQPEIPDQLLPFFDMTGSPTHSIPKPSLNMNIGSTGIWDTTASGMPWPQRYPEMSSFEKARGYAQLWKNLEETRGHNLGGAIYCWSDYQTDNGALPGITDCEGRLKPAYYALRELWTGQSKRFPIQDVILKTDHIFHNGENFFQLSAIFPYDPAQKYSYEWRMGSDDEQEPPRLLTHAGEGNATWAGLTNKFREKTGKSFHTTQKGRILRIRQDETLPGQRIYFYLSDGKNHVATASMPIDPNHIIQRIPWQ
ncbi:MAG: hypothetical protein WA004_00500 [Saprospiraceae bacterium]